MNDVSETDKVFVPYFSNLIIENFSKITGRHVSRYQECELKQFLLEWSLNCLNEVVND